MQFTLFKKTFPEFPRLQEAFQNVYATELGVIEGLEATFVKHFHAFAISQLPSLTSTLSAIEEKGADMVYLQKALFTQFSCMTEDFDPIKTNQEELAAKFYEMQSAEKQVKKLHEDLIKAKSKMEAFSQKNDQVNVQKMSDSIKSMESEAEEAESRLERMRSEYDQASFDAQTRFVEILTSLIGGMCQAKLNHAEKMAQIGEFLEQKGKEFVIDEDETIKRLRKKLDAFNLIQIE